MSTRMQTLIEKMGGVVRVGAKPFDPLSRKNNVKISRC